MPSLAKEVDMITYNTVKVDGLDIFYREAGSKDSPTIDRKSVV